MSHRASGERGVSLIEVMLALVILTVVLLALAGLMYEVASQTRDSTGATYRAAALQRASAWMEGVPWDQIGTSVGCSADSTGLLTYTRCVSYQDSTVDLRRLAVVVAPTGTFVAQPETLVVYRQRDRRLSPFQ